VASAHFVSRSGKPRRRWVKVSLMVVCGLLFPTGLVLGWGPSSDKTDAPALLEKALAMPVEVLPWKLYGDAGYDADWIHACCREEHGVEALIKPATCRADGTLGGTYRSEMTKAKLQRSGYGQRWQIESFFSGLKRTTGSALSARQDLTLHHEAAFRVLAYTLNRR
jgi:transposase